MVRAVSVALCPNPGIVHFSILVEQVEYGQNISVVHRIALLYILMVFGFLGNVLILCHQPIVIYHYTMFFLSFQ